MFVEKIQSDKLALLVVDAQRMFRLDRPDWDAAMAAAVAGMNRYIGMFRKAGAPIVFLRYRGPTHMPYQGPDGEDWLPGLDFRPGDIEVEKRRMNGFLDTDLDETLKSLGVKGIIMSGMITQCCVMSTYYSAWDHGYTPCLAEGALISTEDRMNDAAEVVCRYTDGSVLTRYFESEDRVDR